MQEVRICFLVNPKNPEEAALEPCGLSMTVGQSEQPIPYDELTKSIGEAEIRKLLEYAGLSEIVSAEDVRIITPEEYDARFGEQQPE